MKDDLKTLSKKIKRFNNDRDWDKFHNPKDLLLALVSEVGELAECYRWLSDDEIRKVHADVQKRQKVENEIADIMHYLITFCYKTNIDLSKAILQKLEINKKRYPVKIIKGTHTNPIEGIKR